MSTAPKYIPHYTVDDYQHWEGDWELCGGIPVAMTPSPFGRHSKLVVNFCTALMNAIDAANCDATVLVELDWVVSRDTVLRPDVIVVCGREPERHVEATPALVVEILSESTRERDLNFKREIYRQQSLPYYLIVDPDASQLRVLQLNDDGDYVETEFAEDLSLRLCDECQISVNIESLFR